ncbi:TetR/AcrR family transcriptional regulator [Smaragdicoccus niigatensis]|uniref:TetR/AcrR family transcriptional regulator n=1 Tax=Smaragdicoccus niigatensis TaxID=359359 RepID=UPI0003695954|nr:TetR/AcrR family transcriptional regulator [Smaragdicoccus niigatensis]
MNEVGDSNHSPPRPATRRRTRSRAALLDAAEQVFIEGRVATLKVEELAERAGVSVGTIYTQFGSKDGVFLALAERALDTAAAYLAEAFAVAESPLEQVAATGAAYLQLLLDNPVLARYFVTDPLSLAGQSDEVRARIEGRAQELIDAVASGIQAAIDAGQAQPMDSKLMANFLLASWNGVIAATQRPDALALSIQTAQDCIEQARRFLLDGMSTPEYRDSRGHSKARLLDVPRPVTGDVLP